MTLLDGNPASQDNITIVLHMDGETGTKGENSSFSDSDCCKSVTVDRRVMVNRIEEHSHVSSTFPTTLCSDFFFEFLVKNETGLNLYIDLSTATPVDWLRRRNPEILCPHAFSSQRSSSECSEERNSNMDFSISDVTRCRSGNIKRARTEFSVLNVRREVDVTAASEKWSPIFSNIFMPVEMGKDSDLDSFGGGSNSIACENTTFKCYENNACPGPYPNTTSFPDYNRAGEKLLTTWKCSASSMNTTDAPTASSILHVTEGRQFSAPVFLIENITRDFNQHACSSCVEEVSERQLAFDSSESSISLKDSILPSKSHEHAEFSPDQRLDCQSSTAKQTFDMQAPWPIQEPNPNILQRISEVESTSQKSSTISLDISLIKQLARINEGIIHKSDCKKTPLGKSLRKVKKLARTIALESVELSEKLTKRSKIHKIGGPVIHCIHGNTNISLQVDYLTEMSNQSSAKPDIPSCQFA